MFSPDLVKLYYEKEASLRLCFYYKQEFLNHDLIENPEILFSVLKEKIKVPAQLIVFMHPDWLSFSETQLPSTFKEEDMLEWIYLEQASLFPMLDEEIYFDFNPIHIDESHKKIQIAACNQSLFVFLESALSSLPLKWTHLNIDHPKFDSLNLLPWRQNQKKDHNKKTCFLINSFLMILIILLMIIYIFLNMNINNLKKFNNEIIEKNNEAIISLDLLEKSNKENEKWNRLFDINSSISNDQKILKNKLIFIETERPFFVILNEIKMDNHQIYLYGISKKEENVYDYLNYLNKINQKAKIKSIKKIEKEDFGIEFEIIMDEDE